MLYQSNVAYYHVQDDRRTGFAEFLHYAGTIKALLFYNNGSIHGEYKVFSIDGNVAEHRYYVDNMWVHDFFTDPLSDEERMLLVLKYGAPLLPKKLYSNLLKREIEC